VDIASKQLPNSVAIVALSGKLSLAALADFKSELGDLLAKGHRKIVIDCRELGRISSSGLAALLWARSSASRFGCKIYLTHLSALVTEVLNLTKLASLFRIAPTTRGLLADHGAIRKPHSKRSNTRSKVNSIVPR